MRVPTHPLSVLVAAILALSLFACGATDDAGEGGPNADTSEVADTPDEEDEGADEEVVEADEVGTEASEDTEGSEDAEAPGDTDEGVTDEVAADGGPDCLPVDVVAEATGLELVNGGLSSDGGYCTYANVDVIADQHRLDYRVDRFLDEPPGEGEAVEGLGTWAELELPGLLVIGLPGGGALEIDGRAGKDPLGDAALIVVGELLMDQGF